MAREGYHHYREWEPSERQRQVLDVLVDGRTNAEIAETLRITADGVKWHVSELLAATGLKDRQALATWWKRERRRERYPVLVHLQPWRLAGLVATLGAVAVAVLLVTSVGGNKDRAAPGVSQTPLFADVALEEPPEVLPQTPSPEECPHRGTDLRQMDAAELEAQGFVYENQAFSLHDCPIIAANRPGMSFVRVPFETTITVGEGSRPLIQGTNLKERREIIVDGRSLTVNVSGATRYNSTLPGENQPPGEELAVRAGDAEGRVYSTAVDSAGGLWVKPEPLSGSTVLNYWSGEALNVSSARWLGKLEPEGQFRFTSCYQPSSGEACGVSYRPLEEGLRAPANGTVRCFSSEERANWTNVEEEVGGVELDMGDVLIRFERSHTGAPWLTRPEDCTVRKVQAGDLIGSHYHYWIYALAEGGSHLSVGVTLDGTIVVGDFRPRTECPCTYGS